MKSKITLQERLKDLRVERKLSLKELADATGFSSSALGEYENDEYKGIPHFVITKLAEYYGVSLDYLFDNSPVRNNTNTDIRELGLDDKTIDLLKSGRINNRLLCEVICHPGFTKLLADTEIYVDGVAAQSIQAINAYADTIRKRITNEYDPKDDDQGLLILDACRIEEDRYFLDKLQIDMEPIVKDIREAHIGDKETATDTTVADRVNEIFDNVKKSEEGNGVPDFLQILTTQFCLEIGMSPKNMSLQEIETLQSIFVRSKRYKQVINQTKNKKMKKKR
jgi:transcriptional regulator with XRE-family HTH domain